MTISETLPPADLTKDDDDGWEQPKTRSRNRIKKPISLVALRKEVNMTITPDHPRRKYYSREWEEKKNVQHWGQRKLLLSEILFLTRWGHLASTVLYVGASPGFHIKYLMTLFPDHNFILVDPNPFQIEASERITLHNRLFDEEMAQSFAGQKLLFISDIRTADHRQMSLKENEQMVAKDNEAQIKWVQILKPIKAMLKYRCPYANVIDGGSQMFKGTLFLQAWAPPSSTETRLVVDDSFELTTYDHLAYEEWLFHHNSVDRLKTYSQPIQTGGLDQSYDASMEVLILAEYLETFPDYQYQDPDSPDVDLRSTILQMSGEISKVISPTGRTLSNRYTMATTYKRPELGVCQL